MRMCVWVEAEGSNNSSFNKSVVSSQDQAIFTPFLFQKSMRAFWFLLKRGVIFVFTGGLALFLSLPELFSLEEMHWN